MGKLYRTSELWPEKATWFSGRYKKQPYSPNIVKHRVGVSVSCSRKKTVLCFRSGGKLSLVRRSQGFDGNVNHGMRIYCVRKTFAYS